MATDVRRFQGEDGQKLRQLATRVKWYHTIDLGEGLVTKGTFDIRSQVAKYGFPDDLRGKRALDIGRASGFFSFELERRGAEVTAMDLPTPYNKEYVGGEHTKAVLLKRYAGAPPDDRSDFALACRILRSRVTPLTLRLSELALDRVGGRPFDLVFAGSILNHVKDPASALERILAVTGDLFVLANPFDAADTSREPRMKLIGRKGTKLTAWWLPNLACLEELLLCAGFQDVKPFCTDLVLRKTGSATGGIPHAVFHARKPMDVETGMRPWADLLRQAGRSV
jgi:tRNA (mo5U34)-methyltransferase